MRNRTRYAILGMLLEGERSGYDLKKAFEERVRHFWGESPGQIYPALKSLEEDGYVRSHEADRGARARSVVALTARGRAALRRWFREETAPPPVRNELLLKLYCGGADAPAALLEQVRTFEDTQRELKRRYSAFAREIERLARSPEQEALWKLTLSSGQHVNRARLAWCREAKGVLEALAAGQPA